MSHVGIVAVSRPAFGGTFQYTHSTIEALRRIGSIECTIFTEADNHSYDHLGLPLERLPSAPVGLWRAIGRLLGLRSLGLFSRMDVVIAPIYTTYLMASAPPFAFTLHDLQEKYYPEYFSLKRRLWRNTVNPMLVNRASRVICESRWVKSDIERFFRVPAERIAVITAPPVPTFNEHETATLPLEATAAKLNLPKQFIFYPAQFFPHKNHYRLVEAFAAVSQRHPDCWLLLTGQQKYEYGRVFRRVSELGLAERVRHLGYLETDDLATVYKRATLVVIPTLFESVSIPMYEAFSVGTPVCASNVVALPEQAGDAAVLFDPASVPDIAEKIAQTLGNETLRHELVGRGKRRVAELTTDRYAAELKRLISELQARAVDK